MATKNTPAKTGGAHQIPAVYRQFGELMAKIPSDDDTDPVERILTQLANATTLDDLNAPWNTQGAEQVLNRLIQVMGLKRQPSDYAGGLTTFLVVTAADVETGEVVQFTTGATSIVAQFVKAYSDHGLPWRGWVRQSERPSKNGYYPQHFEFDTGAEPF